jgi:hypothetical protein
MFLSHSGNLALWYFVTKYAACEQERNLRIKTHNFTLLHTGFNVKSVCCLARAANCVGEPTRDFISFLPFKTPVKRWKPSGFYHLHIHSLTNTFLVILVWIYKFTAAQVSLHLDIIQSPRRRRQHVSPKSQRQFINLHGVKIRKNF